MKKTVVIAWGSIVATSGVLLVMASVARLGNREFGLAALDAALALWNIAYGVTYIASEAK